jgi:rhodanese-related sulfurtransferase
LAGGRSAIAASILQKAGFDVINMNGGYEMWQMSGLPSHLGTPAEVASS